MLGMLQYLLKDFQQWQYPVLALLHKISLPYRKAFHSLEHSCAFRHQDDVEVTKIFGRILCIHPQDMKIVYRDTLGPRHSVPSFEASLMLDVNWTSSCCVQVTFLRGVMVIN